MRLDVPLRWHPTVKCHHTGLLAAGMGVCRWSKGTSKEQHILEAAMVPVTVNTALYLWAKVTQRDKQQNGC